MFTQKLNRAEFRVAVEAGISQSPDLSELEKVMLRHVAETETEIGWNFDCGCPASLAGLKTEFPVVKFACAYDDAIRALGLSRYNGPHFVVTP